MGTDEGRLFLNGHVLKLSDGSMGLLLLLSLILYMFIIQNMLLSIIECLKILNGPKCVCRLDLVHELPDSGELQLPLNATPPPPRESKPSVVGAFSLDLAVPFQVLSQRCPFPRERKSVAKRSMKQSRKTPQD